MNNTVKILIIVVVILVGLLGLTGGFILQGYFNNDNNNSTVNQSNATVNNTNNTTTRSSSESNNQQLTGISESQAIEIALNAVGPINQDYYTQATFSTGTPYKWHVDFYNSKTNQHIVGVSINAITGEVRAIYNL